MRRCDDAAASAHTGQERRHVLRIQGVFELYDSRKEVPGTMIGLGGERTRISDKQFAN
jgi:hypothetical protein